VVGEVRAEECVDLLLALNGGLPGMATLHANSAREALVKTCTPPVLAGDNNGDLECLCDRADRRSGFVHDGLPRSRFDTSYASV
jgi:type IV secretory pathway ATPase VirB11/archaellum biosynthesis ATPase